MYIIDPALSKRFKTATILANKEIPKQLLSLLIEDESFWQKREGKVTHGTNFPYYRLRPLHSFELLQKLACSGKLLYNNKPLVCDFFSKLQLEFLAENYHVTGFLSAKKLQISLHECDLVLQGPPHALIKDHFLRFIDPIVSWQMVEMAKNCPQTLSPDAYKKFKKEIVEEGLELLELVTDEIEAPVTAVLELVDQTLAFANFHLKQAGNRIESSDKSFEKMLQEAGFNKKEMTRSAYFCPLDKAESAILCLLDKGWKVYDCNKNEISAPTTHKYQLESKESHFVLRGTIQFGSKEIPVADVAKACKNNERLIPLGNGQSGLLSLKTLGPLTELLHETEIVSDTIQIKKQALSILQDTIHAIECTPEVQKEVKQETEWEVSTLFTGTLRPYQAHGVSWMQNLYTQKLSGLLADEMGLGKTVQVLAFLSQNKSPSLIIVPTSLIYNWKREIERFLPSHKVTVYHGQDRKLDNSDITLTSFGIVRSEFSLLSSKLYRCIIVDEAQNIKNKDSLTFKALSALKSEFRLSLTGTPIENSLSELINHFQFLQPDLIQSVPESNSSLRKKVRPFLLRRKKEEVAKELPAKIEETVYLTMQPEQRALYEQFLQSLRKGLIQKISLDGTSKHRMEIFEAILRLRQFCCHPALLPQITLFDPLTPSSKFEAVLDDIQTLLLEGKKVVVFSQFAKMLELFCRHAQKSNWPYLLLDGKTKDREKLVDLFQNDPNYPLFFISLKAGGVGLNLTRADYVLLYDPWWNKAQESQAIDRAHRIGRTDTVFAKRYILLDTIEEKIVELQERKTRLVDSILEEEELADSQTFDELAEFLLKKEL